jgi:hypothetical protein
MSPTTRRIREMSFQVVECDVPPDMTLAEYRRRRTAAATAATVGRASRRPRLGGRRLRRADRG